MNAIEIYAGSDGFKTREMYAALKALGPEGEVATNLFRAQKCSSRAKVYRGRGYRAEAYARKAWTVGNLVGTLTQHATELGITWGWKIDPNQEVHQWVLYVETPHGQASFHMPERGSGPDFAGEWDRKSSETTVLKYAQAALDRIHVQAAANN